MEKQNQRQINKDEIFIKIEIKKPCEFWQKIKAKLGKSYFPKYVELTINTNLNKVLLFVRETSISVMESNKSNINVNHTISKETMLIGLVIALSNEHLKGKKLYKILKTNLNELEIKNAFQFVNKMYLTAAEMLADTIKQTKN